MNNEKNSNFVLINKENPNLNDEGKFEKNVEKIIKTVGQKPLICKEKQDFKSQTTVNDLPLFEATIEKEINGIGMGVLNSGIPYLTQNGLAIMCGVESRSIRKITVDWKNLDKFTILFYTYMLKDLLP